jgi:hypothetical protein
MASERPRPDKCGARCVDKVGLQITPTRTNFNDTEVTLTDEEIAAVRFRSKDGTHIIEGPAEYETLRQFYWSDFDVEAIALKSDTKPEDVQFKRPSYESSAATGIHQALIDGENFYDDSRFDTSPKTDDFPMIGRERPARADQLPTDITYEVVDEDLFPKTTKPQITSTEKASGKLWWIVVCDPDAHLTNNGTELRGYCERWPSNGEERCYLHGGRKDNTYGDINRQTHGLKAKRSTYYQNLAAKERASIEALADSWLEDAPFERDHRAKMTELFRIVIDQHRLWEAQSQYDDDGMVIEQVVGSDEEGNPQTALDENPMNLSYDRLDSRVYSKLKKLGILTDDPSDEQTVELSLSQKLSGLDEEDVN